jgi:subtilisin family serine protease
MEPDARDEARLSRRRLLAGATAAGAAYVAPRMVETSFAAEEGCCLPADMRENDVPGNTFRYVDGELLVARNDDPLVSADILALPGPPVRSDLEEIGIVKYTGVPGDIVQLASDLRNTGAHLNPNHYYRGAPVWQGGPGGPPIDTPAITLPTSGPGAGVTIGIADTGWYPHPDLAGYNINHTAVVATRDPNTGNDDPLVSCIPKRLGCQAGHGTFISSILLQSVPEAELMVSNVLDSNGYGREDEIAFGIVRLGAVGSSIINLSLAGETDHNLQPVGLVGALSKLPRTAVIVCAAGNHGGKGCCSPLTLPKGRLLYPAAFAHNSVFSKRLISVGALSADTPPAIATFSNRPGVTAWSLGQNLVGAFPRGTWFDGRRMNGWVRWRGTSFAAPRVSAAIAEVMSATGVSAGAAWTRVRTASPVFGTGRVIIP